MFLTDPLFWQRCYTQRKTWIISSSGIIFFRFHVMYIFFSFLFAISPLLSSAIIKSTVSHIHSEQPFEGIQKFSLWVYYVWFAFPFKFFFWFRGGGRCFKFFWSTFGLLFCPIPFSRLAPPVRFTCNTAQPYRYTIHINDVSIVYIHANSWKNCVTMKAIHIQKVIV